MVILKPNRTTQWIYKESTINNNPIEQPLLYIYTVILYRRRNIKQIRNHFICVMPVIVIMIPKIIQIIAILSLRDLMIPAIPIPNISTPTIIENFIYKFNNNNKLLSRKPSEAVHSNMNRETDI